MKSAFYLGRGLSRKQLRQLGFRPGFRSTCHATLTQLLRILDPDAMSRISSQLTAVSYECITNDNQFSIDGKTLGGSKDSDGKAIHVLSEFCSEVEQMVGHASSRSMGMEIPYA